MKLPNGWEYSLKLNEAKMLVMEVKMTRWAYFKLLMKTAWSFDIRPIWIKPFAVVWVSVKCLLKGE